MDSSKSITEWGPQDFKKAGMLKLEYIAEHGHPYQPKCKSHTIDLAQEGRKLFLICTNCGDAAYLNEEDDLRVKRRRERNSQTYHNSRVRFV